jgi:ABC-type lipoprotein release transport system permease subunit
MRCIGISARHIQQFYLIEGTVIGWMGLVAGVLFGASGGYIIIQTYEQLAEVGEKPYVFTFP